MNDPIPGIVPLLASARVLARRLEHAEEDVTRSVCAWLNHSVIRPLARQLGLMLAADGLGVAIRQLGQ